MSPGGGGGGGSVQRIRGRIRSPEAGCSVRGVRTAKGSDWEDAVLSLFPMFSEGGVLLLI